MTQMSMEEISKEKVKMILSVLISTTKGPREAYGVLITAIWELNFGLIDNPVNIDALCAEVTTSLKSVHHVPNEHN